MRDLICLSVDERGLPKLGRGSFARLLVRSSGPLMLLGALASMLIAGMAQVRQDTSGIAFKMVTILRGHNAEVVCDV